MSWQKSLFQLLRPSTANIRVKLAYWCKLLCKLAYCAFIILYSLIAELAQGIRLIKLRFYTSIDSQFTLHGLKQTFFMRLHISALKVISSSAISSSKLCWYTMRDGQCVWLHTELFVCLLCKTVIDRIVFCFVSPWRARNVKCFDPKILGKSRMPNYKIFGIFWRSEQ